MNDDIESILSRCRPKIRALLRMRNFYSVPELVQQFKTHIWGLIEYHTPAIYHCARGLLSKVDALQTSFLRKLDVPESQAFLEFNMAPLNVRRDIGLLGSLHKKMFGIAHPKFSSLFPFAPWRISEINGRPRHNKQLHNHHSSILFRESLWRRSIYGLIFTYNRLPQYVVDLDNISEFQTALTHQVRTRCELGSIVWSKCLDPEHN